MIKANILNLSLSTTVVVGTTGGAIYYSKRSGANNQPVTNMAGVGNEYKSSGDSNIVNDLTNLLNIDLTSVSDLAKNINQLGGLDKIANLPGDLSSLTDNEEEGEALEEDGTEEESDDEIEDGDEVEGLEEVGGDQKKAVADDKTLDKTPKVDVVGGAEEDEVVESDETETQVQDDTTKNTETEIPAPAEETQEPVVEEVPVPIPKEESTEKGNTDITEAEPAEKEPVIVDPSTEVGELSTPPKNEEEKSEVVQTLMDDEKDKQSADGLEATEIEDSIEEAQQAVREVLAKEQAENPSTGIEMPKPGLHGETIDLSLKETSPAIVEDEPAPITEGLTDGSDVDGSDNGEDLKGAATDTGVSIENIDNASSVLPVKTSTETEETATPTQGEGTDIDGTSPPNTLGDSEITQVNEPIKDAPKDIDAGPVSDDNLSGEPQDIESAPTVLPTSSHADTDLTGSDAEPIPPKSLPEGAVSGPEKQEGITQSPNADVGPKDQKPIAKGEMTELVQPTGKIISKDSSKGESDVGVTGGTQGELEEEVGEEEIQDEAETALEDDATESAVLEEVADEDIVDNSADDASSTNIITLINSIASSIT